MFGRRPRGEGRIASEGDLRGLVPSFIQLTEERQTRGLRSYMFVACFKIIKQLIREEAVMVRENFSESTKKKKYERILLKAV